MKPEDREVARREAAGELAELDQPPALFRPGEKSARARDAVRTLTGQHHLPDHPMVTDYAYAAALLEFHGTVQIREWVRKRGEFYRLTVEIRLPPDFDYMPLALAYEAVFGGHSKRTKHHWVWEVRDQMAMSFLRLVRPYLKLRDTKGAFNWAESFWNECFRPVLEGANVDSQRLARAQWYQAKLAEHMRVPDAAEGGQIIEGKKVHHEA